MREGAVKTVYVIQSRNKKRKKTQFTAHIVHGEKACPWHGGTRPKKKAAGRIRQE